MVGNDLNWEGEWKVQNDPRLEVRSDDSDDYRVVMDLEVVHGENKWLREEEGMASRMWAHFTLLWAIAEAGDNKAFIREAYVVNEQFFSCVKAAPARL